MMTKTQLKKRWTHDKLTIAERVLGGDFNYADPFPVTAEGYRDYRGIVPKDGLGQRKYEKFNFSFITESEQGPILGGATCIDCLFQKCDIKMNIGIKFENCNFDNARVTPTIAIGSFTRCTFHSTNFRNIFAVDVTFFDCIFDRSDMRRASFLNSRFTNCSFQGVVFGKGSFAGSVFKNCSISIDDLWDDITEDTEFI